MNLILKEKFIIDDKGHKTGVVLDLKEYNQILNILEDLEDLHFIKQHKNDKKISLDKFIAELKKSN